MSFILGKKLRMSQVWEGETVVPVTLVKAIPNTITQVRTKDKDGYTAVQVSLGRTKREFRVDDTAAHEKGAEITVNEFKPGDKVRVSGLMKGRGFAGVVKRHGFHGGPATHGQKNRLRAPGSIGSTAPQRVVPGRKMAGHMGNSRVTILNLRIVQVDPVENLLYIEGGLPGAPGTLLQIIRSVRQK
jgi:large subunit ribosomal protein L3